MSLFKFIPDQFLSSFLDGNLYMNTLEHFAKLEATDVVRSDSAEGADWLAQIESLAIQDPKSGEYVPIGGLLPGFIYRGPGPSGVNVFCMYAMSVERGIPVDLRNLAFGDHFVVMKDMDEFLRRVRVAAERTGRELAYRLVEYVRRDTHDGEMGPFRKLADFEYQCEFRIALFGGDNQPFTLAVGSLRDICMLGPLSEINDRIRLTPPPAKA